MSYSVDIVCRINAVQPPTLGSALGRRCVENRIPVSQVSAAVGVSRQAVYRWFTGQNDVSKHLLDRVQAYYDAIPTGQR